MQIEGSSKCFPQETNLHEELTNPCKSEVTTLVFINMNLYEDSLEEFRKGIEQIKIIFLQDYNPYRFIDRNIIRRILQLIHLDEISRQCLLDTLWILEKITQYAYFHNILQELYISKIIVSVAHQNATQESLILIIQCLKNICSDKIIAKSLIAESIVPTLSLLFHRQASNNINQLQQQICCAMTTIFSHSNALSERDVVLGLEILSRKKGVKSKAISLLGNAIFFYVMRYDKGELITHLIKDGSSSISLTMYPNLNLKLLQKLANHICKDGNMTNSRYFIQSLEELLRHSRSLVRYNSFLLLNHLIRRNISIISYLQQKSSIIERSFELLELGEERLQKQCLIFLRLISLHPTVFRHYNISLPFISILNYNCNPSIISFSLIQLRKILLNEKNQSQRNGQSCAEKLHSAKYGFIVEQFRRKSQISYLVDRILYQRMIDIKFI